LKRWLYIVHRWIGIASCLLFAMWFLSGLVMIYVPFPSLTKAERLAAQPVIDWGAVRAPLTSGAAMPHATLEMQGAAPVWRVPPGEGPEQVLSALDGTKVAAADERVAARTAALFAHAPVVRIASIERDQWTVAGGFNRHRPLWRTELGGPGGRVLYVSGTTGAVVLDTNGNERFWNWLGSVPHWLYFTAIRQDNAVWRQVVMWVSGPCIVAGITGFWIGILRTRVGRRRFKGGRTTPYRGWMLWHHWAGLIGGIALIGWIFSGWLSVDPFRLFASGGVESRSLAAYESAGAAPRIDYAALARLAPDARQVELRWLGGRPLLEVRRSGSTTVLDAVTLAPFRAEPQFEQLIPGARIAGIDRLTAPDAYWYEVGTLPQLPVLRVRYDDPARTWAYVDPASGALLQTVDTRHRLYRWLFDLLHKWDFNVLTLHRPGWDVLLWLLSLFGIVTSVSGILIGWKRLTRKSGAKRLRQA
jgi:uncharacterized iron-regulated membrane protein